MASLSKVLTIARIVWLEAIRRKDIYVFLILAGAFLASIATLGLFGLGGTTRYVLDCGLLMSWVFGLVLAVLSACRQLPQEESRGTLIPLLAKPVTRAEVILGKWFGAWTATLAAVAVFDALVVAVVAARGGRMDPPSLVQSLLLRGVLLGMVTALSLLASTRLSADAAGWLTLVLTAAAWMVVPRIPEALTRETGLRASALLALYHALPHLELFDLRRRIVHDFGPVSWSSASLIALYGLAYAGVFLTAAWLAYRNKRFSRQDRI